MKPKPKPMPSRAAIVELVKEIQKFKQISIGWGMVETESRMFTLADRIERQKGEGEGEEMTIVEAVLEALHETKNEGIGYGDHGLIGCVIKKIDKTHKVPKWPYKHATILNWEQKILNALDHSPFFEKRYSRVRYNRLARSFYLKEPKS